MYLTYKRGKVTSSLPSPKSHSVGLIAGGGFQFQPLPTPCRERPTSLKLVVVAQACCCSSLLLLNLVAARCDQHPHYLALEKPDRYCDAFVPILIPLLLLHLCLAQVFLAAGTVTEDMHVLRPMVKEPLGEVVAATCRLD
jgi:hypothetical protein